MKRCARMPIRNNNTGTHAAAGFPTTCRQCHSTTAWKPANWQHTTAFALSAGHARRKGTELSAGATPYYKAARSNLLIVVDDEPDDQRIAWAYYLLMRCSVFFQDWGDAHEEIEQAIVIGRPTGALLAQWREFQALLREKLGPLEDE